MAEAPWLTCSPCGVSWLGLDPCWSCGADGQIGPPPRPKVYAAPLAHDEPCGHPICAELITEARWH